MHRLPAVAVLFAAGVALGDGGIVPDPGADIYEFGQVAVMSYFDGVERLAIASGVRGNAERIAWILPAPARPDVDTVSQGFFSELAHHCRPLYRNSGFGCGSPAPMPGGRELGADSLGMEEIESGIIGDYEYEVLRVEVAESLAAYLEREGFRPASDPLPVFEHYLDRGWNYFVVAQLHDTMRHYYDSHLGIGFRFESDEPVYPLHISRIGSEYSAVVLYVLAEHRMHFPGAELWFSGRVGPETFGEDMGFVSRACRLTRLMKYYEPEQMEDITLVPAPDDRDFRRVTGGSGTWYGSLGPMLLLAGVLFFRRRRQ